VQESDLVLLLVDAHRGHSAAEELERLSSFVDACLLQTYYGLKSNTSDERCSDKDEQNSAQHVEMMLLLPAQAAKDFLGKPGRLLGEAMRDCGVIITLELSPSGNSTCLRLQGTRQEIQSLSCSLSARRYFSDWTSNCKSQMERQLLAWSSPEQPLAKVSEQPAVLEAESFLPRHLQRCHRGVVCTKADKVGDALGAVVNIAACNKAPILWMTNGSEMRDLVPPPSSAALLRRLLS